MGLRCLLGHEYANREVEREREERGDEVVVTYRTVETCDRCGERRIVSENKEVRPVRNPREDGVTTGLGDDGGVTPDLEEPADGDDAPTPDAAAESPPDPEGDADAEAEAEAEAATAADAEPAPESRDDEDDAIILDEEDAGDDGRGHGEWPDADDGSGETAADPGTEAPAQTVDDGTTVVSGDNAWPEPEGEDEGFDAEPSDGDPADVSFGGGLAPERADETAPGEGAAATNGPTSVAGKQFVAAEAVERVGEESAGETEFFCPNCGYTRAAGGSSMRAGDICPDCHQGYIAERER